MPAMQSQVNLLGSDDLTRTSFGRILTWAVSYGRYIMIGTEIIVLLAFISRFSLDRKLTDLNEAIAQKKSIIEVNMPLESKIRSLHATLDSVSSILHLSRTLSDLVDYIQSITPADVYLESLTVTNNTLVLNAVAGTPQGFSQFLANINVIKRLKNVEVGKVRRSPLTGTSFELRGDIDPNQPVAME